ncbi:MAG: HEAT repeat domain-containing protein [Pirellulaceae bacterium]
MAIGFTASNGARAEVFVLTQGGRIEGRLVNADQQPRATYVVATITGEVTLAADQVEEVISKTAAEARYEEILPRMPASAEGNLKMATWCERIGLPELRRRHLEKVLEYDPENKEARYALGFSFLDGQWVRPDEFMESRGYVRYRGSWRLPQEVALEEAAESAEVREKEWRKQIKMWRGWIVKGRSQADEGLRNLRQLDDPVAAAGLADLIGEEEFPQMRVILVETLGRLKTPLGIATFAKLAAEDPDPKVRDVAIDQLIAFGGERAIPLLVNYLTDKDNVVVNRAAVALGSIGDPSATVALIDALSTKHKFIIQTGGVGNSNAGFSNDGAGGGTFSQGGGPKLVETELPNRGALDALTAIHRVNFQYDKQRWKDWYAQQRTPEVPNLRRD